MKQKNTSSDLYYANLNLKNSIKLGEIEVILEKHFHFMFKLKLLVIYTGKH